MKFGYVILYVEDVALSVEFYEKAFGLTRRFIHESGQYAELETGETKLAFVSHQLASSNLENGFRKTDLDDLPPAFEVAFVVEDVQAAFDRAVSEGAVAIAGPVTKPWGQIVAYVRDNSGVLVELATELDQ